MQNKETIYGMAMSHARKNPAPRQPEKIKIGRELLMTFSNQRSLLSSKKIERFVAFWTFLILTVWYIYRNIDDMGSLDFIEVVAPWLAYSGYNTLISHRDKKLDITNPPAADPSQGPAADGPPIEQAPQ